METRSHGGAGSTVRAAATVGAHRADCLIPATERIRKRGLKVSYPPSPSPWPYLRYRSTATCTFSSTPSTLTRSIPSFRRSMLIG